jgi:hypothetical protein
MLANASVVVIQDIRDATEMDRPLTRATFHQVLLEALAQVRLDAPGAIRRGVLNELAAPRARQVRIRRGRGRTAVPTEQNEHVRQSFR